MRRALKCRRRSAPRTSGRGLHLAPDRIDPENQDIAFGLCDLGMGFPALGAVIITELRALRGRLDLPVERDLNFKAGKTLSANAAEASRLGRISACCA